MITLGSEATDAVEELVELIDRELGQRTIRGCRTSCGRLCLSRRFLDIETGGPDHL